MALGVVRRINERVFPRHLAFGPTHVVLGVNNFCNLHCRMCDVGTGNDETNFGANLVGAKTRSMPIDLYRHIVDEIAAYCPRAHLGFAFTEPLAWAPLGEALRYARTKGLYASVTTNGLLLPRRAAEIAGHCQSLSVSLDGPEAVHDHIRRHKGSFAKAVAGIEAVAALAPQPEISVYCTISEWNIGTLRQFLRDLRHLPLKRVGLLHNNFVTNAQAHEHNRLYDGDLHATPSNIFESDLQKIDLVHLSAELTDIMADTYPFSLLVQPALVTRKDLEIYYRNPEVPMGRRCHDVHRILMIDADGEVIPAHGRCFRFPIANIRNHSLREVWHHPKLSSLRETLRDAGGLLPACSRCCSGFG